MSKNSEKETNELIEFLTEKCQNVVQPSRLYQLLIEFKEKVGSTRSMPYLYSRVKSYCSTIHTREGLDLETKVKQLFGLAYPINSELLEELEKEAFIELDEKRRIIKYSAKNGSLELEGEHKYAERSGRKSEIVNDNEEEESLLRNANSTPKGNNRQSGKRELNDSIDSIVDVSGASSSEPKKKKKKSVDGIQDCLVLRHKELSRFDFKPTIASSEITSRNQIVPLATHKKFLESIQAMIITLDLPIDEEIQWRIESTIEMIERYEVVGKSNNIEIDDIYTAVNGCLLIVTRTSDSDGYEESKGLQNFLLLLRNAIILLKLSALEDLQLKIKRSIDELLIEDKKIPIQKIQYALGIIINIIAP